MAACNEERRESSILSQSVEEANPKPLKVTSGEEMDSSIIRGSHVDNKAVISNHIFLRQNGCNRMHTLV